MGRISRDARLLFIEIWTICDDYGKARASSRMLASLLFPYDDDAPLLIDGWLGELEREDCIIRYQVDGTHYLRVEKWQSHQKVDHPSKSGFPDPRESLDNPREASRPRARAQTEDQGPRTKEGDQGKIPPSGENGKYRFSGKVVKLNEQDYLSWRNQFSNIIDFDAELHRCDDAVREKPKGWFPAVSAMLNAKHQAIAKDASQANQSLFGRAAI